LEARYEKLILGEGGSIRAFSANLPRFDAPWHFHPECELTLITQSSGMRYVGNHVDDFKPGDLVLLGANLPHCWKNTVENTDGSSSIVIQWDPTIFPDLPEFRQIQLLMQRAVKGIKYNFERAESLKPMLSSMVDSSPLERYLALVEVLNILAIEREVSFLAGSNYEYDLSRQTGERLERIQSFVQKKYATKVTLRSVSAEVHMSEQSFSRFFSKHMTRPFFQFLNEYRINVASNMLLETDIQVADIGFACGYESLPFFFKQFKKIKGHTPLGYRKLFTKSIE